MKRVKIYGERNTGTNYLTKLVENNFKVDILKGKISDHSIFMYREWTKDLYFSLTKNKNYGWKHSMISREFLKFYRDNVVIITISKNPYSFLLSLFKRSYHYIGDKPHTFSEFIRSEWKLVKRDNICNKNSLANPIELWNIKNKSYISHLSNFDNSILLKYEDLLDNPSKVFNDISILLNQPLKNDFSNYENSTKGDNKNSDDYRKYYLNEEWRKEMIVKDIQYINRYLDHDVTSFFNYKILNHE